VNTSYIKEDILIHKNSQSLQNTLFKRIRFNNSFQNVVKLIDSSCSLAADEVIINDNI